MIGFKLLSIVALAASAFALPIDSLNGTALEARTARTYTGDGTSFLQVIVVLGLALRIIVFFSATYFAPGLGACGKTNGPNDLIAAASYKLFDTYP